MAKWRITDNLGKSFTNPNYKPFTAKTKAEAEAIAQEWSQGYGVDTYVLGKDGCWHAKYEGGRRTG